MATKWLNAGSACDEIASIIRSGENVSRWNGFDRAISGCVVGLPVQSHPDRKTHRCVILNNLNATNGLAPATV
jgi:hypothetical protein